MKRFLTDRDKKMINFIHNTNMIFTIRQISDIFYKTGNSNSSYVIATRRLKIVREFGYLKMTEKVMGEPSIYYRDRLPKNPKHRLIMSEFLRQLSLNGFNIISVDLEYQGFKKDYDLVPDMRIMMEYNNKKYVIFVEVDLTKEFTSEDKYYSVFKNISNLRNEIPYSTILVSISDKKHTFTKVKPICIDTDFKMFNNFVWVFVK